MIITIIIIIILTYLVTLTINLSSNTPLPEFFSPHREYSLRLHQYAMEWTKWQSADSSITRGIQESSKDTFFTIDFYHTAAHRNVYNIFMFDDCYITLN